MYSVHTISTFSLFLKKILFIFLFNNFLIANKIESISVEDAGFSKERLNKIDEIFIKVYLYVNVQQTFNKVNCTPKLQNVAIIALPPK